MTEDRIRPLAAFALVSLLCAFILSINLTRDSQPLVVSDSVAHTTIAGSDVIFGDTLTPRPGIQASGSFSASLDGVGPLSRLVSRAMPAGAEGSAGGDVSATASGRSGVADASAGHQVALIAGTPKPSATTQSQTPAPTTAASTAGTGRRGHAQVTTTSTGEGGAGGSTLAAPTPSTTSTSLATRTRTNHGHGWGSHPGKYHGHRNHGNGAHSATGDNVANAGPPGHAYGHRSHGQGHGYGHEHAHRGSSHRGGAHQHR